MSRGVSYVSVGPVGLPHGKASTTKPTHKPFTCFITYVPARFLFWRSELYPPCSVDTKIPRVGGKLPAWASSSLVGAGVR
jgi:hypothetical protein